MWKITCPELMILFVMVINLKMPKPVDVFKFMNKLFSCSGDMSMKENYSFVAGSKLFWIFLTISRRLKKPLVGKELTHYNDT